MTSNDATNPYRSPAEGESAERPARRKTKWRIIPTAALGIWATLGVVGSCGMLVASIYLGWIMESPSYHRLFGNHGRLLFTFILFTSLLGNIAGVAAARDIWRGRWFRAIILAAIYGVSVASTAWLFDSFER